MLEDNVVKAYRRSLEDNYFAAYEGLDAKNKKVAEAKFQELRINFRILAAALKKRMDGQAIRRSTHRGFIRGALLLTVIFTVVNLYRFGSVFDLPMETNILSAIFLGSFIFLYIAALGVTEVIENANENLILVHMERVLPFLGQNIYSLCALHLTAEHLWGKVVDPRDLLFRHSEKQSKSNDLRLRKDFGFGPYLYKSGKSDPIDEEIFHSLGSLVEMKLRQASLPVDATSGSIDKHEFHHGYWDFAEFREEYSKVGAGG